MVLDLEASFAEAVTVSDDDPKLGPTESRQTNTALMGDVVETQLGEVRIHADIVGSAPIERIEVRNGMETVETIRPAVEQVAEGNRIRVVWEGAEYRGRFRQTIWDGEARFEGNEIIAAEPINFLNPDRKLERIGNNRAAITMKTYKPFDPDAPETIRRAFFAFPEIVTRVLNGRVRITRAMEGKETEVWTLEDTGGWLY